MNRLISRHRSRLQNHKLGSAGTDSLSGGNVRTGDLHDGFWGFGAWTQTCEHTRLDAVSPRSLPSALTGPWIPGVQLYYEAQDQEQERASYFKNRAVPFLLDSHTHSVHVHITVFEVSLCMNALTLQTAHHQCLFSLSRLKCPYDVSVELAAYCLQSK